MRNRYEMATLYWACQLLGIVFTPVSWRATADEIKYCLEDAEAAARGVRRRLGRCRRRGRCCAQDRPATRDHCRRRQGRRYGRSHDCAMRAASPVPPAVERILDLPDALHLRAPPGGPKGVPRSHRSELTASISHIAQNQYRQGDSCLGVMPFFHTMGVRILLERGAAQRPIGVRARIFARGGSTADLRRAADDALSRAHHVPRRAATSEVRLLRPALAVARRLRRHDHDAGADRALPGSARAGAVRQLLRVERDLHLQLLRPSRPQARLRRARRDEPDHPRRLAVARRRHRGRSAARRSPARSSPA